MSEAIVTERGKLGRGPKGEDLILSRSEVAIIKHLRGLTREAGRRPFMTVLRCVDGIYTIQDCMPPARMQ